MTQPTTNNSPSPISTGTFISIVFALIFAVAAFFSGMTYGSTSGTQGAALFSAFTQQNEPEVSSADMSEFWEVWKLMDDKFATASSSDELSTEEKIQGAISGLVTSYQDPYSVYLVPEDAQAFDEDISGNFSGVGMEVGMRDGMITVISPLPNSPAEEAGVVAGDIIVAIDGESTEQMSIDSAVKRIRGETGADVALTIVRDGKSELLEIVITRENITIPTIETDQQGDIFIISLYSFNALAEANMQEALREYIRSDANKLILDLRGNPGGYLQSAISISSYFLPTGKVVVTESFGDERANQIFRSQGRVIQNFTEDSLVILVDGGSASASEIVAGALTEHNVATLMGSQTFGKGSVQELVNLDSGASLKVTIARWLTPNGTSISDGGLTPDYTVPRTPQQIVDEEDPQLEAAVQYLNGEDISQYTATSSTTGE